MSLESQTHQAKSASHGREADLYAESSDRYNDVRQVVDSLHSHVSDFNQYLQYLFQYDVDPSLLQSIAGKLKSVSSDLDNVLSDVIAEEADSYHRKQNAEKERNKERNNVSDSERYSQAMNAYNSGNIRKARSMFAALSRYATSKDVRSYSKRCFDMINEWENSQQNGREMSNV